MYLASASPTPTLGVWNLSSFSDWLQETRERRGLSQRALATKAGVSSAMVSRVESGDVGASPEMAERFADALDVPRSGALKAWLADRISGEEATGYGTVYDADPDIAVIGEALNNLPATARPQVAQATKDFINSLARSIASPASGDGDKEGRYGSGYAEKDTRRIREVAPPDEDDD